MTSREAALQPARLALAGRPRRRGGMWTALTVAELALAHGVVNTIGMVAFFLVGAVHALW